MIFGINIASTGKKGWLWLLLRWILIFGALIMVYNFMTTMPGKSFSGSFQPLSQEEVQVRKALQGHVRVLAGEIGERNLEDYESLQRSVEYIKGAFEGLGYSVEEQPFEVKGKIVKNLEVEIPGRVSREKIVIVGAHYDSVFGSPGANDNASGIAGLLELARIYREKSTNYTVRFVAFVNEEPPYFQTKDMGSLRYASRSKERGEDIVGMLSLETIGSYSDLPGSQQYPFPWEFFYGDKGNFIAFVANLSSRSLVRTAISLFRRQADFPSNGIAAPGWLTGIGFSDHWAFWKNGYPAIMITDTAPFRYFHYHSYADTPNKLDYDRMARIILGVSAVIEGLSQ